MKGKPLTPDESQEPTEYEKVIEGLAKILQLTYIMSIGEVAHPTRNRMEPVPISSNNDLKVLFSKHWNEFKDKNPRDDLKNFKASQRKRIQSILDEILEKIPSFEHQDSKGNLNELYLDVGKYINEYLTNHKEAIKPNETKPEPENGVKAWIICLEQQEKESVPQVIERIKQMYNWKFNYNQLKNGFIPDVKNIFDRVYNKNCKPEATEKQQSDLILSMSFLKDEKSIKKARTILKTLI
jgi:hypothetical protein